jgi:hypothetical protein
VFFSLSVLRSLSSVLGLLFSVLCLPSLSHAGFGFDAGQDVVTYARWLDLADIKGSNGQWLRVRGIAGSGGEGDHAGRTKAGDRAALIALHQRGVRVCVILRWGAGEWKSGGRAGGGHRLPVDLREAYERGRRLGETYGDIVDVWEIENEPDIGFIADNPEVYAAFLKACYLGLKTGARSWELRAKSLSWLDRKQGWVSGLGANSSQLTAHSSSRVVMAPLALPPGPYLERIWANGIASYTDGFNYHYYGFAEDFSGAYGQFRDAVRILNTESTEVSESNQSSISARSASSVLKKKWPIFITEYGYGRMDADARHTVQGRVEQWRFFADVAEQIRDLRIAAPMVFVLNPYHEADLNEFGLTSEKQMGFSDGEGREARGEGPRKTALPHAVSNSEVSADSVLKFTPADFGEKKPQPWMKRIGLKVGDWYASPALAYLWDYAERKPYRPLDWSVRVAPASPVVIDFVAGAYMRQRKVSGAYLLEGRWMPAAWLIKPPPPWAQSRSGLGTFVLYNFSDQPLSGRLVIGCGPGGWISGVPERINLAAGERRELSVELAVQAATLTTTEVSARFVPDEPGKPVSVWSTRLLPNSDGMVAQRVRDFDHSADVIQARQSVLLKRPLGTGESPLLKDGRWLVSDGVRVEERDGVWRFHVDYLPAESLRPAVAELPLPADFAFNAGEWVMFERRIGAGREARGARREDESLELGAGSYELGAVARRSEDGGRSVSGGTRIHPSRLKSRAGAAGDMIDMYFRTENGNLFQTWPRLRMSTDWTYYAARSEDFTMAFYGRTELPWRFSENKPAALVFFLRPSQLPAVFEMRGAQINRWAAP